MRLDDQITENDLLPNKRKAMLSDTNKNLALGSQREKIMNQNKQRHYFFEPGLSIEDDMMQLNDASLGMSNHPFGDNHNSSAEDELRVLNNHLAFNQLFS